MTTKETYNQIVEEVQSRTAFDQLLPGNDNSEKLLVDYTSKSKLDPWRSIAWVVACVLAAFRGEFELFKKETTLNARSYRVGTVEWWLTTIYGFQMGDSLQIESGKPYYAVEDAAKRIISNASHQVQSGLNLIKVVKGVFPAFEPLSVVEVDSFRSYLKRVAPPGIAFGVISSASEQVKLVGNVFYSGTKNSTYIQNAVEAMIDAYIKYLPVEGQNSVFNGTFVRNELIDKIREMEGVNDFELIEVVITVDGIDKVPGRIYQPVSGWMRIADSHPLSQTLQYYASYV